MRPRANIHLDADAYSFASAYASAKGIPLGTAVSELIRQAERSRAATTEVSQRLKTTTRGYLVRAGRGRIVTPEIVKHASEDEIG